MKAEPVVAESMSLAPNRVWWHAGGLLLFMLTGCGPSTPDAMPQPVSSSPAPAQSGVLDCTGTLHPANSFTLRLKPGQTLEKVHVQVGAQVQSDVVLATFLSPDLQAAWLAACERVLSQRRDAAQIETLTQKRAAAQKRLTELDQRVAREQALSGKVTGYDPKVHARALLDEKVNLEEEARQLAMEIAWRSKAVEDSARIVRVLELRLPQIEASLSNLIVKAPFAGTVVRVEPVPEAADNVVLELQDRSRFEVRGVLWQNQLPTVTAGAQVSIVPDFMPGHSWKGKVVSIGLVPVSGSTASFPKYPVVVALDEGIDPAPLRDGMTAVMRIESTALPPSRAH